MNERIGPIPLPSGHAVGRVRATLRRIGFWASIVLPLSYLPVMYALSGTEMFGTLAALLVVNVVSLFCGRRYGV